MFYIHLYESTNHPGVNSKILFFILVQSIHTTDIKYVILYKRGVTSYKRNIFISRICCFVSITDQINPIFVLTGIDHHLLLVFE